MRPAHPVIALILSAGLLVVMGLGASAQGTAGGVPVKSPVATPVTTWGGTVREVLTRMQATADRTQVWVRRSYARRPAVMIGLAGALSLPPLALAGYFLYRRRPGEIAAPVLEAEILQRACAAWIEVDGAGRIAMPQTRDLIQIGRHEDNDVCLHDESVHRYHAVIERSARQGFVVVDISGPEGNGLAVNGERCVHSRLADGDVLEVGNAKLRFAMAA